MVNESDFEIVNSCCSCDNPIYRDITNNSYYFSCWCNFTREKHRKLTINFIKQGENKVEVCDKICENRVA